jgi:DNA-binding MarR family transcriptional regulator
MSTDRLANEAWEALFRAQVLLMRRFADDDVWDEVTQVEYDVLYTLSKSETGMSMVELNRGILMTQGGVSKLIARLVHRGLVRRTADPVDRRTSCIALTDEGRAVQHRVGRRHAATVSDAMTAALDEPGLAQLRDLAGRLIAANQTVPARTQEPR